MTFNKKYAIRKLAIGVASVAIGISFIDGNVLAAPNSNLVSYSSSSAESYVLSNSDETPSLHSWIKDKIAQIDFDALTKDEFYSLVSSDGKSYGDIRKIVSDWKDAKIPNGTYSIKKLTIVDVPYIDLEEFAQEVLLFSYQLTYYDKDKQVVLSTCYQWN